jgi:hypothetical protein
MHGDLGIGNNEGLAPVTTFPVTRLRLSRFAAVAVCALCVLSATESLADLNRIACDAIWRGCLADCRGAGTNCYRSCGRDRIACWNAGLTKQQTSPPPCTGVRCSLPVHNPPTSVGQPTRPPGYPVRPVKPVKPVSVGNPNTGNSPPVILLRKNDSGGQGHRH